MLIYVCCCLFSQIDLTNLEEIQTKYPQMMNLPYEEYVLCPGDLFFLPRGHWHYFQAINRSQALDWFQSKGLLLPSDYSQHTQGISSEPKEKRPRRIDPEIEYSISITFWWDRKNLTKTETNIS